MFTSPDGLVFDTYDEYEAYMAQYNARQNVTTPTQPVTEAPLDERQEAINRFREIRDFEPPAPETIKPPAEGDGAEPDPMKAFQDRLDKMEQEYNDRLTKQQQQFEDAMKRMQDQADAQREAELQSQRRSAFDVMRERFANYGLPELATEIENIYKGVGKDRFGKDITEIPTTESAFYLQLLNTQAYYDRFGKVNEDRVNAGYKALDEKTILGLEDEYQNAMKSYNMPAGFYDTAQDFQTFLRNDKSPSEVADDLQAYRDFVDAQKAAKPEVFNALKTFYGVDESMLTAYYADPMKGQKILDQVVGRNKNTAAALIAGLSADVATAANAYGAGSLTYQQQRQRYSAVQQDISTTGRLAEIYGMNYGTQEALGAEFGSDAAALAAQKRVQQTAAAQFAGSSGVGRGALGRRSTGSL
jgi:hypothetical protein